MKRAWRAIVAGFWGGMLAGVLDALATLLGSGHVLGVANGVHLALIDAGLGAMAGAALVVVCAGWTLALQRHPPRSPWFSAGHVVTLVLALPVVVYDAVALFRGPQAARIPGHRLLSAALILLGAGVIWVAVTLWGRLVGRTELSPNMAAARTGRKAWGLTSGLVLLATAAALDHANRHVLPRLYPWFHLSLSLSTLLVCVLAVRVLLGLGSRLWAKRWSCLLAGAAVLALAGAAIVERPRVLRSQSLRYFVYEKTHIASLFVRVLPSVKTAPASLSLSPVPAAIAELPPLAPGPHRPGSDIVLITIDALRADHVGCYGYARATTPAIDALAARGVRFAHAYTQAPHTSFSLASVMIGKYYPTLARLAASEGHETLATIMRRYGWKTAAFFPPAVFYIDAHKMKAFEATNFDFEYVKYEYLSAEERIGQIQAFLTAEHPQKLFLWLHLFEPHEPYDKHAGFDFGTGDLDRYDSEIAYADSVVGKVVRLIERERPGAIVVIAADHGEEFGEHGGRYHGTTLFEEQVHVPLVVVAPGLVPHVVDGPVQLIDIPETLLGLLDFPQPARMRGTDLGPWLAPSAAPESRLPPAFAELEDKRMVVLGHEKLVCDVSKDFCSYFDLATDPQEQHDLADRRPERLAFLRQELDRWLGEQARYETKLVGADAGGDLARAIERGRLGDASVAPTLAALLMGSFPVEARREAASLLVTVLPPKQGLLPALLRATQGSDDEDTRSWAAVAATRLGASATLDRVRAAVADPRPNAEALRMHAALVLAERGDSTGLEVLSSSLDRCDRDVGLCKRVVAALGSLKDARATKALVEHLDFVQTRLQTVEALAAIGDAGCVPSLVGLLENDAYVPVRAAAATALGHLGGARATQALRSASSREHESTVLAAIHAALAAHGRR
jgi:arylsulfatase A-like enzyme/HEAT repeat protein